MTTIETIRLIGTRNQVSFRWPVSNKNTKFYLVGGFETVGGRLPSRAGAGGEVLGKHNGPKPHNGH